MFRFSHRSCGGIVYPTLLGVVGLNKYDAPADTPTAQKVKDEILSKEVPTMTGWERVKEMYNMDSETGLSVELQYCIQMSTVASLVGFAIGGLDKSKFAVAEFKERNQATLFQNTFDAQRSLSDYVTKQFLRGGIPMAAKLGSFLLCYSLACSTISCYRNKTSISDFAIGGTLTGAIFTANRGLPGAISGGSVGLFLGTVTGCAVAGLLYVAGLNMEEIRMWHYEQARQRKKLEHKSYLLERERSHKEEEEVAFYMISEEEKKEGRIVDHLKVVEKKGVVEVVIPELPPVSMYKEETKK